MDPIDESWPDGPMTKEQQERVALLSESDVCRIDQAILELAAFDHRRKVTRVVGDAMQILREEEFCHGVPDLFFAQRVRVLVEEGRLSSFGDLSRMRYSEVWKPST